MSHTEGCRLCGDLAAIESARCYIRYRHEDEEQLLRTLCEPHLSRFETWLIRHTSHGDPYGRLIRSDEFNEWIGGILMKLAKRAKSGMPIERCQLLRVDSAFRCCNFASKSWRNHEVCGMCHAILRQSRSKHFMFTKDVLSTRAHLEGAISVLIGQRVAA